MSLSSLRIWPRATRACTGRLGVSRAAHIVLCAVLMVASSGWAADAHKPIAIGETFPSRKQALRIEDLDVSQVAYVTLTAQEPEFWMTFELSEPADLFLSLGLPVIERLATYRPQVTVFGPEVDDSTEGRTFETFAVDQPERFHEPFTGTDSWIFLEETISLELPGTYYIVASAPPEEADKLWVAVGRREAFGLRDILSLPSVIRNVRAFHEVEPKMPAQMDWATLIALALIGVILVLAAIRSLE